MNDSNVDKARNIALELIDANTPVSLDEIRTAVEKARGLIELTDSDADQLTRRIESEIVVRVDSADVLDGEGDHVEWLREQISIIDWSLTKRYHRWLSESLPHSVVGRLDQVTDQILERLENPHRPGAWDRRGMVVGYVQSGKTSNYTSLICKAADAGYKVIIVLAGMDNALRSQTQIRIDEGVLGFDTQGRFLADQPNARIGVGHSVLAANIKVHSLTSSFEEGDFKKSTAQSLGVLPGSDPIVLVVKKNVSILRNVLQWLTSYSPQTESRDGGRVKVVGLPLLVIDDECDNASVNTNPDGEDSNPTKINERIRVLLNSFEKSAYVGYTATPFANVFIAPESEDIEHYGEDLFPRDFIVALKRPTNYVGPTRVFGLDGDAGLDIDEVEPLPIIRNIANFHDWMPYGHKKTHVVDDLPASLEEAIMSFVLVCSARRARGQTDKHNSMLVHVTRFVDVQEGVKEVVADCVAEIRQRIRYGDGTRTPSIIDSLRDLWNRDFVPTTEILEPDSSIDWLDVESELDAAIQSMEVRSINGSSKDALDYLNHPGGLNVIAIGGAKLSRGLTLEGLSVSYYVRTTTMYDTLMQMGRWFGYRPGYLDLCRLYTTRELCDSYREVAMATEDLLLQLDEMSAINATPREFGLRVRQSPTGLTITRAGAMRKATRMKVSYSGTVSETVTFNLSQQVLEQNVETVRKLIVACDDQSQAKPKTPDQAGSTTIWEHVPVEVILDFLGSRGFQTHKNSPRANSALLRRYIEGRISADPSELTEWTVALISVSRSKDYLKVAGHSVGPIERAAQFNSADEARIKRLLSPNDEAIDLTESETEIVRAKTLENWMAQGKGADGKRPTQIDARIVRALRPASRGVLLVYFVQLTQPTNEGTLEPPAPFPAVGVSFPESRDALHSAVDYYVNEVYQEQELEGW